jgi:hypothetical protein
MNLEELKKHVRAVTEFEWCGQKIWLRKLSAKDHLELLGRIKDEATKEHTPESSRQATLKYHVTVAARSVADDQGNLLFDTEEGRQTLEQVGFAELCELGELVLSHNGYGSQKKSES